MAYSRISPAHRNIGEFRRATRKRGAHSRTLSRRRRRQAPKFRTPTRLAAVQQAATAITDNRMAVRAMTERVRELRGKLHAAVVAFQTGGRRYTALDQARDFAATAQAERAKRLADVPAELRNKYGKAADFTRKRMENGPERGAFTGRRARTALCPGQSGRTGTGRSASRRKVQCMSTE